MRTEDDDIRAGMSVGPVPLGDAELAEGLSAILAARPEADGLWLFGYGALLWQSLAAFAAVEPARLPGWRRRFCLWSMVSRGNPARPGLGLGLVAGGATEGLALRVPEAEFGTLLAKVWRQEMYAGLYRPAWLPAERIEGGERQVLAFVAAPGHPQFVDTLSLADQAAIIRDAVGENGPCREYLSKSVAALEQWGLADPEMAALLALVDA